MKRKKIVKEVIERIEKQNDSILELVNKEENLMGKIQKKLDMIKIGRKKRQDKKRNRKGRNRKIK